MHKRYLICFWGSNILLQSGYLVPKIILQYAFTLTKQQLNMVHSTKNGKNRSTVYVQPARCLQNRAVKYQLKEAAWG